MGITIVPRYKKDPDRKKTKTVRKPITTKSFAKGEVTKSGKFTSLSNKNIQNLQKALTRRSVGEKARKQRRNEAAKETNTTLARMNRASGEAARRARKRNTR